MRRSLLSVPLATCLLPLLPAAPAHASLLSFPADTVCSVPVDLDLTTAKSRAHESPQGTQTTGVTKVLLTNPDNGKTLSINASGPTHVHGATLTETGSWLYLLFPGDATGPGIFVLKGKVTETRGDFGVITSLSSTGPRSADLCAQLT